MTANEVMIIRDYLTRKRWYFAGGFIIHLIAMTGCWWMGTPIFLGIFGGSAFILCSNCNAVEMPRRERCFRCR